MGKRVQLQLLLETLIGSKNVYFQPPENVKMNYPCIIYSRDSAYINYADDISYNCTIRYEIKVVDANPDSALLEKIITLPMCTWERHYTVDNLNHDIYKLYY